MKNRKYERLRRSQRQYHRNHSWDLTSDGLFIPHCYDEVDPERLSWWDDVGFILNKRRVIVDWQHPRCVYKNEIEEHAFNAVDDCTIEDDLFESVPEYKKIGRSRKRIIGYTMLNREHRSDYFEKLDAVIERLSKSGINYSVMPSVKRSRYDWADSLSIVAPIEIHSEVGIQDLARLAREIMLGHTTVKQEFPDYIYSDTDWLREQH